MKPRFLILILAFCLLLCACKKEETTMETTTAPNAPVQALPTETLPLETETQPETAVPEPAPGDFVRVLDYIPDMYQELKYAADRNFTGQVIYDFSDAYLRYGTVKKLAAVCNDLAELGLSLKIWDGFRPVSAQFKLWEVCPDPTFVANPEKGFSSHSRGNTVDVTLVDRDGNELEMPSEFDDFSAKADRDYSDVEEEAAINALLLEETMIEAGFKPYSSEWWHFSDTDSYEVEENFTP